MSRLFISHSSGNNAEAVAIRDWLAGEGWDDVFLDLDPERGIAAGERWERALNEAASRCAAVLFLVSCAWLDSRWCLKEFNLARRLNKRLFGVLIEAIPVADLPADLTGTWQVVDLASGQDHTMFRVTLPRTHEEVHVTFSKEGLTQLRNGLAKAGLDPRFFAWPREHEPGRPPYRGLKPLEAEDAGIFFGRDAPIVEALDTLRGLRDGAAPRLLVILGASGAGKSSFLRAGLLPRLARDDRNFLPLSVVRPERAAITGETGLLHAVEAALAAHGLSQSRVSIRDAIAGGAESVRPLFGQLVDKVFATMLADESDAKRPVIVLAIDQAEELFLGEGAEEGQALLALVRDLVREDRPGIIALFTIRSDSYDRLETAKVFEGMRQQTLPLLPMPRGAYQTVIEGPAARLKETSSTLTIEARLTQRLLEDIEKGGGSDALPLLAFTLEQLYLDYGASGALKLANYEAFGGVRGAIEAAVKRALAAADNDARIPRNREARLALLRRGLIPWLAGIDPETASPRRRIARFSEIPVEARPLIEHFVEQRLLATDVAKDTGEHTIEPAHEALLRQWGLLQGWLAEDAGLLSVMDGVKRASRDWAANGKTAAWLTHTTARLEAAERLQGRPDLAAHLEPTDREYLAACRKAEGAARARTRRVRALIYVLLVGIIAGLVGWINQAYVKEQMNWYMTMWPYKVANVDPYVLKPEAERGLKPLASFRECAKNCPEMIVIPAGSFKMGSPAIEYGRYTSEGPQHEVTIAKPFAVSKFDVTYADWDACVSVGGCPNVMDGGMGRGTKPVIYVSWDEAQQYVGWLSKMTAKPYRLLTEAEWEYAARAGATTPYPWGYEIGTGNAHCGSCGSKLNGRETAPVGSFKPNAFGLYDMAGNVWQRVQDCYHDNYIGAPTDGSEWISGECSRRVIRGGSWVNLPDALRSAYRNGARTEIREIGYGFRVARTLTTKVIE
jgi:formylglycine-generating enzyme required for sulfatase activity